MNEFQNKTKQKVCCANGNVYRACGFWTEAVHKLLNHLKTEQFHAAPEVLGFDESGNEILSYVHGKVYDYPLEDEIASEEALISAAELLKQYHEATRSFIRNESFKNLKWLLPPREPYEVICHGDYAPYNVALEGCRTVGVFDFDAAHPAPAIWDVAYAVYSWTPFKADGDLSSQIHRTKLFCDSYSLPLTERKELVSTIITRIKALIDFMHSEAQNGNPAFISNIRDGHHISYMTDIQYLSEHIQTISAALQK